MKHRHDGLSSGRSQTFSRLAGLATLLLAIAGGAVLLAPPVPVSTLRDVATPVLQRRLDNRLLFPKYADLASARETPFEFAQVSRVEVAMQQEQTEPAPPPPPQPAAPATAPAVDTTGLMLVGTAPAGESGHALIHDQQSALVRLLRVGEKLRGARVESVDDSRVVLRRGEATAELQMQPIAGHDALAGQLAGGPPPPQSQAAVPQPAAPQAQAMTPQPPVPPVQVAALQPASQMPPPSAPMPQAAPMPQTNAPTPQAAPMPQANAPAPQANAPTPQAAPMPQANAPAPQANAAVPPPPTAPGTDPGAEPLPLPLPPPDSAAQPLATETGQAPDPNTPAPEPAAGAGVAAAAAPAAGATPTRAATAAGQPTATPPTGPARSLGVSGHMLSFAKQQELGLAQSGLLVTAVRAPDSPILSDDVVLAIAGLGFDSIAEAQQLLRAAPDDTVQLELFRAGNKLSVDAPLTNQQ